jgi:ribosomal protein S18 acetylase RimI-like enzyme
VQGGGVPSQPQVRKATPDDVPALARSLARAFYEDPVFAWMLPDPADRLQRAERGFAFYLRKVYLPHEQCYTLAGGGGGALWLPPGQWHLGLFEQLRLAPGMIRATGRRLPWILMALAKIESNHPSADHHYLAFVGVEPELQGKGMGTALMRPVLERCDRDGLPAYLEASSPRNRACYERQGFEVTEEFHFPRGGPPSWRMWREPRRGSG